MKKAQTVTAHQNPETKERYTKVNNQYMQVKIFPTDNGLVYRLYKVRRGYEACAENNINKYPGETITTEMPIW